MVVFTGREAPDLAGTYCQADIDGQTVSVFFSTEVLQDLHGVSREDLAEFCKETNRQETKRGVVLTIRTDDLHRFREQTTG